MISYYLPVEEKELDRLNRYWFRNPIPMAPNLWKQGIPQRSQRKPKDEDKSLEK